MHYIEDLYFKTLKYDLSNKFLYKTTKELPRLQKIVLNFGCKTTGIKSLSASLLSLELITQQKGVLTQSKNSDILLKVRKGNPVGCKVVLKNVRMFKFLVRFLLEIFPKSKDLKGLKLNQRLNQNTFSYQLLDVLNFSDLEKNYYLFYNLPQLKISFITNTKLKKELTFLLTSLQLPLVNDY